MASCCATIHGYNGSATCDGAISRVNVQLAMHSEFMQCDCSVEPLRPRRQLLLAEAALRGLCLSENTRSGSTLLGGGSDTFQSATSCEQRAFEMQAGLGFDRW